MWEKLVLLPPRVSDVSQQALLQPFVCVCARWTVWESFMCGCENKCVCVCVRVEVCVFRSAWRPDDCGRTSSVDPLCFLFKE